MSSVELVMCTTRIYYVTASCVVFQQLALSALTLLVGWQEGNPACKKTEWWVAGVVICLERGADLHMAQLMPLSLASVKSRLVLPADSGSPRQRAVKWACVCCVCVCVCVCVLFQKSQVWEM